MNLSDTGLGSGWERRRKLLFLEHTSIDVPNRLCLVTTATAAEEGNVILTVLAKDLIFANALLEEMYSWRGNHLKYLKIPVLVC